MAKTDLTQFAQAALPEGEELLAVVRVNWNGMVPPVPLVSTGIAGLSAPVAELMDGPPEPPPQPDPDALVAFPSAKQMAMALTGYRLLLWSLGFSGKPKDYLGEVPLSAIVECETDSAGYGDVLRITLASTAVVDLEIIRGEPAATFVRQLEHLIYGD